MFIINVIDVAKNFIRIRFSHSLLVLNFKDRQKHLKNSSK